MCLKVVAATRLVVTTGLVVRMHLAERVVLHLFSCERERSTFAGRKCSQGRALAGKGAARVESASAWAVGRWCR